MIAAEPKATKNCDATGLSMLDCGRIWFMDLVQRKAEMIDEGRLQAVVRHYRIWCQERAEAIRWWKADGVDLANAIDRIAKACMEDGRKHDHQRRVSPRVLCVCSKRLLSEASRIAACNSFEDVFRLVSDALDGVRGAGEMLIYDTTDRLALRLGLAPDRVYLHAGTAEGAKALKLVGRGVRSIDLAQLPAPLRVLSAREAEDVLCIYKSVFAGALLPPDSQPSCRGSSPRIRRC